MYQQFPKISGTLVPDMIKKVKCAFLADEIFPIYELQLPDGSMAECVFVKNKWMIVDDSELPPSEYDDADFGAGAAGDTSRAFVVQDYDDDIPSASLENLFSPPKSDQTASTSLSRNTPMDYTDDDMNYILAPLMMRQENGRYMLDHSVADIPRDVTKLDIPEAKNLTDAGIKHLPAGLLYLNVRENKNFTDACIVSLPKTLTLLDLRDNENLTDACVKYLPRSLKHLNLTHNKKLSDASVADLPEGLTYLNLFYNFRLTDASIRYLPRTLKYLNLCSNENITDASIMDLPRSLTYLNLRLAKLTIKARNYLPKQLEQFISKLN